jgi:hypothetical protein
MSRPYSLLILVLLLVAFGCGSPPPSTEGGKGKAALPGIEGEVLKRLSGQRIYFGHQSVGFNIVDGVRDTASAGNGAVLPILDAPPDAPLPEGKGLLHGKIGKNRHPLQKIEGFRSLLLDDGRGTPPDVALFKFCYVDFDGNTDVAALFNAYRGAVDEIRAKRPSVRIAHATVPLTSGDEGWKARLLVRLGRRPSEVPGNVRRNRFNELLRAEYEGKEPLFDLARLESTLPDGSRSTFESEGRSWERLAPGYTDDGGHLNGAGKARVGAAFLAFLGAIPPR